MNAQYIESEEQILAEQPIVDSSFQFDIGGRDDARVDLVGRIVA